MSSVCVDAADFRRGVAGAGRAASRDHAAGTLRCVLVAASEGTLRLVATDKRRLAVAELPVADAAGPTFSTLVDSQALAQVDVPEACSTVEVALVAGQLRITADGWSHELPGVEGDFPDYERFLVAEAAVKALVVQTDALLEAIEDQTDDEPLRLRFSKGRLELGGIVPIRIPATYDGATFKTAVDPEFLHDAVQSVAGPEVVIEGSDPLRPLVVRSASDDSYTGVIMPIRLG